MVDSIRVLHVDNDPEFADLTATYLEEEDSRFTVETATSAADGLDRFGNGVDCVVSDYGIDGTNGLELLEAVREEYPDFPFILFTDDGDEDIASDAIAAGVTDYLQKTPREEQYKALADRILSAVEQARARERSEVRERVVQEMNDVAVIVQDGVIRYMGPGVHELLGYAEDYPVDRPMTEFIAPESRETVWTRHREWMADNQTDPPNQYELELLSKDQQQVPVEISVSRIEYMGQPATLSIIRGITERKHQEERFQAFIEHSTDIITVLGPDGTYRYQSPSSKRVLGYEPDELIGQSAFEYVHPDDREGVVETFTEAVATPEMTPTAEYRLQHKNGSWRWIESIGNNQLDNPAIEGFVVNSRDITEQKEKQRELQRQNERLERFAGVVSHDLRNPLSVARARMDLAQDAHDSEHLDAIEQAHERMEQLIDQVLALAREGKTVSDTEPVSLTATARQSWQTVATAEATLSIEADRTIRANRSRLQQLLENLFRNAVEHGGEDVCIRVTELRGEAGFAVADDGPGIPEDERDSAFEPGYSTSENGTGLGLTIVDEIVGAQDWGISVTEGEDDGARFEITGVNIVD